MAQRPAVARREAGGRWWLLCGLLLAGLGALLPARAADPEPQGDYCRWREFNIPFNASDSRIVKVLLYVSEDQGRTWVYRATAQPSLGHKWFEFKAQRDGWFWFTVQTMDANGQAYPAQVEAGTAPSRKVCVDTVRPRVSLQGIAAPSGQAGVSWTIQDENLNNLKQNKPDALVLEYRVAGRDVAWTRVSAEAKATGQATWPVATAAPLEVRLRAADDAGNQGEFTATITPGVASPGGGAAVAAGGGSDAGGSHGGPMQRQFTNSKRINLKYDLQEVGRSGVSVVEVWSTTDGRSWELLKQWKETPKGLLDKPTPIPLTFENEGLYGFTLVPRSGVGRGAPGPQPGDEPQIWIEVDWTRPNVRLRSADAGRGPDDGFLLVSWSAEDKNLADHPITLCWGPSATGPWKPLAENLANDGFYRWRIDENTVPVEFYVKVQARDRAGNAGEAVSTELIKVDLKQPKASVSGIEPIPGSP